jgi:tellurite resistance protein TerC
MIWLWIVFVLVILFFLALDLGVFNRKDHVIGIKEALRWTSLWVSLSLSFNVFVYFAYENHFLGIGTSHTLMHPKGLEGWQAAVLYFTGYVIELSLSVDNLFVIALIFTYFAVPPIYQHRVLFWGILGALVMRGIMIGLGAILIQNFSWIIYIFGAFLLLTAIKLAFAGDEEQDPSKNLVLRLARRFLPIADGFDGRKFMTYDRNGKRVFTTLFLALLVVEGTDVIFAVDSVPAIFGITDDPFIVFTSNVFAILGLRSMYFALAGLMREFHYLKTSLAIILGFVGVKMLAKDLVHDIPGLPFITLGVIALVLGSGVVASIVWARTHPEDEAAAPPAPVPISTNDPPPQQ